MNPDILKEPIYCRCPENPMCDDHELYFQFGKGDEGWQLFCLACGGFTRPEPDHFIQALREHLRQHAPNREDELFKALQVAKDALSKAAVRFRDNEDSNGGRIASDAAKAASDVLYRDLK